MSMKEGKRFVDTKPEDISGRFLRLASASAQVTLLPLSHFRQTRFTEIYSFPSTTQNNFHSTILSVCIYLFILIICAGGTEYIEMKRMKMINTVYLKKTPLRAIENIRGKS